MSRSEKLRQLLEKEPDDAFLNYGLAMELVKEERIDEALERFDRVIQLDPCDTAAHFHKGNTLIGLQRFDEAQSVLEAGLAAARNNGNAHAESEIQELLDSIPYNPGRM